jgi:hypothetical protein
VPGNDVLKGANYEFTEESGKTIENSLLKLKAYQSDSYLKIT